MIGWEIVNGELKLKSLWSDHIRTENLLQMTDMLGDDWERNMFCGGMTKQLLKMMVMMVVINFGGLNQCRGMVMVQN